MPARESSRPAEERTILLVEDYDAIRLLMKSYLQRQGFRVVEARDGDEAVRVAGRECATLRLIVMDLNMPEVDGLTAAQTIRQCGEKCAGVPIIAVTAYDTFGIEEAAREAGCNAYITKPLDNVSQLEKTVSGFLYG